MARLKIKNASGIWEEVPLIEGKSAYQVAAANGYTGTAVS